MEKAKKKKTSLWMKEEVLKELKVLAAQNDTTITDILDKALADYLAKIKKEKTA